MSDSQDSFTTARTTPSSEDYQDARERIGWTQNDVLTAGSFPCTSTLRWKGYRDTNPLCSCGEKEQHATLQKFCREVLSPCVKGDYPVPETKVCWNAENIWECKLPKELTGLDKRVEFESMPSIWYAQKVLFKGTYWFRRLIRKDSNGQVGRNGVAVLRLLAGLNSYSGKEPVYKLVERPIKNGGVQKLRSILATVDGLIMQLVLAFPQWEELLSWERIDQIVHCMICNLLPDWFRDSDDHRITTFEKVKSLRKAMKMEGFNPIGDLSTIDIPREMSFFEVITNFLKDRKTPISLYRISILCQNRASGVPPHVIYLKTLEKIKQVLTEPADPAVYNRVKSYIGDSVDEVHQEVVDSLGSETSAREFWSKVIDQAKISLSDSGEFFHPTKVGGKLEACRQVLQQNPEIQEMDLETGNYTGRVLREGDHIGTRLFHWACGQFKDRRTIYDRNVMSVRLSLVAELGKYRGITVSHIAHAVLLHVMSHILLAYLRAIPSSRSGITASNHAWNFFKLMSHKNPSANFLFGDKEVYLFSTDWETATDYCDHTVAQAIINRMAYNVGFPTWYRQTSIFALCAPRQIEEISEEDKTLRCYFTTRGELMGDPVVKVILHAYHLVIRKAAIRQMRLTKAHFIA